ncbi:MAG: AAA family ATPase [bacterium]|nr:AAA family ATPase [bacterium]
MRPHTITMEAFGPFPDKQFIDFDSYNDFFLVTGPTGAGKSTIFDAIMFALYGQLPGTRDPKSVVSSYVENKVTPSVELVFSFKGKRYKIVRIPAHRRLAKKGEKRLVDEDMSVEFYEDSNDEWFPITGKPSEINNRITRLIHLSADEFAKIVILPQGEFQKFLIADTKDKRALLEKIFPIDEHEKIAQLMKDKAKGKQDELKLRTDEQKNLRKEFDPDTYEEDHKKLLEELKNSTRRYEEGKKEFERLTRELTRAESIEEQFVEFDTLEKQLKILDSQKQEFKEKQEKLSLARRAKEIQPFVGKYTERQKEIEKEEQNKASSEKRLLKEEALYKEAEKESRNIPELEEKTRKHMEELGRLEALLPKEKELKKKEEALEKAQARYTAMIDAFGKKKSESQSLDETVEKLKTAIKEDEARSSEYETVVDELARITRVYREAQKISGLGKEKGDIAVKIKEVLKELSHAEKSLRVNIKQEEQLIAKKEAAQAANLAAGLESGKPCPVCGSTEHPVPANVDAEEFTDEEKLRAAARNIKNTEKEISKWKERHKNFEDRIKRCDEEIAALTSEETLTEAAAQAKKKGTEKKKQELEGIKNRLRKQRTELDALEKKQKEEAATLKEWQDKMSAFELKQKTLEAEVEFIGKELKDTPDIGGSIGQLNRTIETNRKTIETIQSRLNKSARNVEGITQSLRTIAKNLEEQNKRLDLSREEMEKHLAASDFPSAKKAALYFLPDAEIKALDTAIQEYFNSRLSLESRFKSVTEKIDKTERPNIEVIKQEKEQKGKEFDLSEREKNDTGNRIKDLEKIKKSYDGLSEKIEQLMTESDTLVKLSNDLNGKNRKNLNFQGYVLGAYLREVTRFASKRLQLMSDDRYTLHVTEEITHGNREAGLDLDVFDSHTGQQRSVKTLSGGEKFLASISLALGLSDVIQARSGEIELDAIFIDEGFGSLDDTALDRALTILDDIRGNRMVGIISHVNELKRRIPSQVKVIKETRGSVINQV